LFIHVGSEFDQKRAAIMAATAVSGRRTEAVSELLTRDIVLRSSLNWSFLSFLRADSSAFSSFPSPFGALHMSVLQRPPMRAIAPASPPSIPAIAPRKTPSPIVPPTAPQLLISGAHVAIVGFNSLAPDFPLILAANLVSLWHLRASENGRRARTMKRTGRDRIAGYCRRRAAWTKEGRGGRRERLVD
ncbi:hypothetical protein PENTCL1PPCAC_5050, partial [Pristionchus entomophagus]